MTGQKSWVKSGLVAIIVGLLSGMWGSVFNSNPVFALESPPAELPRVLLINQVRGDECCNPGTLENVTSQLTATKTYQLPAYFALRYDVLTNPTWVEHLQSQQADHSPLIQFGVLLEITPELAQAAGVEYRGTADTWFAAQNIFTIGYSVADRQKLIDTLLAEFRQQFGYYPQLSSAWMTDTPTLNYLHDRYGVQLHQITREQWGLDSYTLDGGPVHYPYPASRNWAFVPDYQQPNPLLIVRQTVADPLYTYGDRTSAFTSQPNDYSLDGKTFSYFKDLLDQALTQPLTPGFALIGLENSMPAATQEEYQRQLEYIAALHQAGQIQISSLGYEQAVSASQPVTTYSGRDLVAGRPEQVTWVNTPDYRVRLRQKGSSLFIDDLRLFDSNLTDPYQTYQAVSQGYWITPYLLNGAIWYQPATPTPSIGKGLIPESWERSFGVESPVLFPSLNHSQTDLQTLPQQLTLPSLNSVNGERDKPAEWQRLSPTEVAFKYQKPGNSRSYIPAFRGSAQGQPVNIRFSAKNIKIEGLTASEIGMYEPPMTDSPVVVTRTADGWELNWPTTAGPSQQLITSCQDQQCVLNFSLNPTIFETQRHDQYPTLFPEVKPRPLDDQSVRVVAHNRYAVAGRNPIRLIATMADDRGFPTVLPTVPVVTTDQPTEVTIQALAHHQQPWYYLDITSAVAQSVTVTVTINDHQYHQTVFFAPNCKTNIGGCVSHPRWLWWYVLATITSKI